MKGQNMNISRLSVYAALPLCAAMLSSCGKDSPIFVSPSGSVSGLMVSISAPSAEDGYYPWWEYGTGFTVVSDARDVSDAMISLTDGASATAVAEVDDAAGKVWCLRCGYEPDGFDGTVAFSVPADQPKTAAGSYGQDVSSNMLFFSTAGIIGDGRQAEVEMVPVTSAIALKIITLILYSIFSMNYFIKYIVSAISAMLIISTIVFLLFYLVDAAREITIEEKHSRSK